MLTLVTQMTCDRSGCPAPACEQFVFYGQDFYFCRHHAAEAMLLVGDAAASPPSWREPGNGQERRTLATVSRP